VLSRQAKSQPSRHPVDAFWAPSRSGPLMGNAAREQLITSTGFGVLSRLRNPLTFKLIVHGLCTYQDSSKFTDKHNCQVLPSLLTHIDTAGWLTIADEWEGSPKVHDISDIERIAPGRSTLGVLSMSIDSRISPDLESGLARIGTRTHRRVTLPLPWRPCQQRRGRKTVDI